MEIFIADMDGTLLDQNAQVSTWSTQCLNKLISRGMHFSIATARTPLSVIPILRDISINLPMILMNGALIYDAQEHRFLHTVDFGAACMQSLAEAETQAGVQGMLFVMEHGCLRTYLGQAKEYLWDGYFDLDAFQGLGVISTELGRAGAAALCNAKVVYALYMDDRPEKLAQMGGMLKGRPGLTMDLYQDVYTKDRWYLELMSAQTSKRHALDRLRALCGATRIVGFGDGWNDLPLFEGCDECYAVANASPAIKARATGVIGSNLEDGVAHYLKERWELHETHIDR